jgi:hypothetical protein
MQPTELHFFDFDGTLFRSPWEPKWWRKEKRPWWWRHEFSLSPPCVPDRPPNDWWIGSAVMDAKKAISQSGVYTVLATGRSDQAPINRLVPKLLRGKGIGGFDEIHLNPGGSSKKFKLILIEKILDRYPSIQRVEVWDDKADHVNAFVSLAVQRGLETDGHVIPVDPHEVMCDEAQIARVASRWLARIANRRASVDSLGKLLRYLQKPGWEKAREAVQIRDSEGNTGQFGEWLLDYYGPGGRTESTDPYVLNVLEDPDAVMFQDPEGYRKETYEDYFRHGDWENQEWYRPNSDAPSWFNLQSPKVRKGQWFIHYTFSADAIACRGFRHGQADLSRLGGHTSNALDAQRSTGRFNFAYNVRDEAQYVKGHGKYGNEAVLFRAAGVEAWHSGDQEWQVVFQGSTAKDIVPLRRGDHGWLAGSLEREFPSLTAAVKWVTANYKRYEGQLGCP